MANPSELAADAFANNILLVRALLLQKPPKERDIAKRWADHLSTAANTAEEHATKNEYLWYLLMNLQYGTAPTPPFDHYPKQGYIPPLSTLLGEKMYEEVKKGAKTDIFFHDTLRDVRNRKIQRDKAREDDEYSYLDLVNPKVGWSPEEDTNDTHPSAFFENQPKPNDGCFCYAAVFSDYSEDAS